MPRPRRTRPPVVPAVALPLALLFALWTWPSAAAPTANVPAPNVPSPAVAAPSVTGQVLGSGGVPLAGVTVRFAPLASAYGVESALWEGREPEPPLAEGRTDVAGRFAWEGMPGMFRVTVLAEGFVPMTFPVLPLVDDLALPPVVLHPAETARVETVDAAGRPLRGIGVMARSADRSLFEQPEKSAWRPAPRRGWTDAAGVLDLVRGRGERLDLFAHAPGSPTPVEALGVRRARLVVGAPGSSTPLRLRGDAGGAAAGVVAAVPGTGWPVARLDGGTELDLASAGELLLVAGDGRRLRVDLSAAPGPIALPEPATVVGVVRSLGEDPSTPLAGALVWPSHDPGAAVLTDGEGRFRLRAGVGDRFRIQA
ncbi:MAG: carboxypeptidase-like regulatory domain-containing protein, partial [Acidobacteriota bacterium]